MKTLLDPLIIKIHEARELARKINRWKTFKALDNALKVSGLESMEKRTKEDFYAKK